MWVTEYDVALNNGTLTNSQKEYRKNQKVWLDPLHASKRIATRSKNLGYIIDIGIKLLFYSIEDVIALSHVNDRLCGCYDNFIKVVESGEVWESGYITVHKAFIHVYSGGQDIGPKVGESETNYKERMKYQRAKLAAQISDNEKKIAMDSLNTMSDFNKFFICNVCGWVRTSEKCECCEDREKDTSYRLHGFHLYNSALDSGKCGELFAEERVLYILSKIAEKYADLFVWQSFMRDIDEEKKEYGLPYEAASLVYQDNNGLIEFSFDLWGTNHVIINVYGARKDDAASKENITEWHNDIPVGADDDSILRYITAFLRYGFDGLYIVAGRTTNGFNTAWWAETFEERMEFYECVSDKDLIKIVDSGNYLEDVPPALCILKSRNHPRVEELARAIITDKKGDKFLQAWAVDFLEDR